MYVADSMGLPPLQQLRWQTVRVLNGTMAMAIGRLVGIALPFLLLEIIDLDA